MYAVWWLVAQMAVPPAPALDMTAGERTPAVLLVVVPKGSEPSVPSSTIIKQAAQVVEARTSLRLLSPEQAGADVGALFACPTAERLSCWVQQLSGELRFLMVLSVTPNADGDVLSAMLIDAAEARAALALDGREAIENAIFDGAALADPWTLSRAEALEAYFEGLLSGPLEPLLREAGMLERLGMVRLELPGEGLVVTLDGRELGSTSGTRVAIDELSAGARTIAVKDPLGRYLPAEQSVSVQPGASAELVFELEPVPVAPVLPEVLFWTGLGLSVAGAAVTAYAALAQPSVVRVRPCAGDCEDSAPRFVGTCEFFAQDPEDCAGGRGVLVAPLGLSMLTAGGALTGGAAVFSEPGWAPWVVVGASVLVGVMTYGVLAVAD